MVESAQIIVVWLLLTMVVVVAVVVVAVFVVVVMVVVAALQMFELVGVAPLPGEQYLVDGVDGPVDGSHVGQGHAGLAEMKTYAGEIQILRPIHLVNKSFSAMK